MYYFGAGVRAYAVENVAIKIHVEGGGGYYYRDMEAQGVPLSIIAAFIPEFEEFEEAVEPETGFGLHVDFGLELFPYSRIEKIFETCFQEVRGKFSFIID